jgi:hypothetical protein
LVEIGGGGVWLLSAKAADVCGFRFQLQIMRLSSVMGTTILAVSVRGGRSSFARPGSRGRLFLNCPLFLSINGRDQALR